MKSKFVQKRGIGYRKFFLYEDKIVVETRDLRKINRYEIPIDQLGVDLQYQADNVIVGKFSVAVLMLISIVSAGSYFFAASEKDRNIGIANSVLFLLIALWVYLKPHADDVYLVGGNTNLMFYRNKPSEEEVQKFIEEVIDALRKFVRKNYLKFDSHTIQEDYFTRLKFYCRKKIISEDEMDELKEQFNLKKLF